MANHHLCRVNQVYELKELQTQLRQKLLPPIESSEAEVMVAWLLEHYLEINRTDLLLNKKVEISPIAGQQLAAAITRLNREEPIQYVLREAFFYGRKFNISPGVLVPRRETEELVAWVKEENSASGLRVLDIGTGSGCIAVTLSREMNHSIVHALDVSEVAVRVATENAALYQATITFWRYDLRRDGLTLPTPFDIIVSNPPYVQRSEAARMASRVLKYEPDEALFVDNQQPLLFYERMVHLCRHEGWLAKEGKIYWEINEAKGDEIVQLLRENRFHDVCLRKDVQGKPRFVAGKLAE